MIRSVVMANRGEIAVRRLGPAPVTASYLNARRRPGRRGGSGLHRAIGRCHRGHGRQDDRAGDRYPVLVQTAAETGYQSTGTAEFLYSPADGEFWFLDWLTEHR